MFILSDFMDEGYDKTLRIAARKHDLTGIRVYDKLEEEMPNLGIVPMVDSETQTIQWVNTRSKKVRQAYVSFNSKRKEEFKNIFKMNGAGAIDCRLDESYVKKLLGYFKARI